MYKGHRNIQKDDEQGLTLASAAHLYKGHRNILKDDQQVLGVERLGCRIVWISMKGMRWENIVNILQDMIYKHELPSTVEPLKNRLHQGPKKSAGFF